MNKKKSIQFSAASIAAAILAIYSGGSLFLLAGCLVAFVGVLLCTKKPLQNVIFVIVSLLMFCGIYSMMTEYYHIMYVQRCMEDVAFTLLFIFGLPISIVLKAVLRSVRLISGKQKLLKWLDYLMTVVFLASLVMCGIAVLASNGYFYSASYVIKEFLILMLIRSLYQEWAAEKPVAKYSLIPAIVIAVALYFILSIVGVGFSSGYSSGSSSSRKCTICKKTATNTFQGSGYCDTHYRDAIVWAMDNVSKR